LVCALLLLGLPQSRTAVGELAAGVRRPNGLFESESWQQYKNLVPPRRQVPQGGNTETQRLELLGELKLRNREAAPQGGGAQSRER
jgi:hypothetical protein